MLEIQVGIAKTSKYASSESGDTIEQIERPRGGFSFVMADGQGSGRGAKTLSNLVTARAIAMLKDGARDGVVARAVHDYLYGYRHGQVSATLNILSVDFSVGRILMSRNSQCPFYTVDPEGVRSFNEASSPIGLYANTKPIVYQHDITPSFYLVAFTDGIMGAGNRYGQDIDLPKYLANIAVAEHPKPSELAHAILLRAIELDQGRPGDDMSIVVLGVVPKDDGQPRIRHLDMTFPLDAPSKR
jgi:serine phosphatase RsbU (regulator of sigma subunit)